MRHAAAFALLLAGCGPTQPAAPPSAGAALEHAAMERGLVAGDVDPVGAYRREGDSVCLVPRGPARYRFGASVDYGEGQRCLARGEANGRGRLRVDLGDGCRFDATLDEDRLTLAAILPASCARFCSGRASLGALAVERLSASAAEAGRMPATDGLLCQG